VEATAGGRSRRSVQWRRRARRGPGGGVAGPALPGDRANESRVGWLKKSMSVRLSDAAYGSNPPSPIVRAAPMRAAGPGRSQLLLPARRGDAGEPFLPAIAGRGVHPTPFYGVRKMTMWLRLQHYAVGPKRVRRLLRSMGLMAVYPKPRLSLNPLEHKRFPICSKVWTSCAQSSLEHRHHVYSAAGGFVYLAAVIDWFSRYVLAWELSNSLEADFCVAVMERAMAPSDRRFSIPIKGAIHQHALPGTGVGGPSAPEHGRPWAGLRHIFVERLWRTVKYEEVYLKDYRDVPEARHGLASISVYNDQRIHQALDYRTPQCVHFAAQ